MKLLVVKNKETIKLKGGLAMRKLKVLLVAMMFMLASVTLAQAQIFGGGSSFSGNSTVNYANNDYTLAGFGGLDLVGAGAGLVGTGALFGGGLGAGAGVLLTAANLIPVVDWLVGAVEGGLLGQAVGTTVLGGGLGLLGGGIGAVAGGLIGLAASGVVNGLGEPVIIPALSGILAGIGGAMAGFGLGNLLPIGNLLSGPIGAIGGGLLGGLGGAALDLLATLPIAAIGTIGGAVLGGGILGGIGLLIGSPIGFLAGGGLGAILGILMPSPIKGALAGLVGIPGGALLGAGLGAAAGAAIAMPFAGFGLGNTADEVIHAGLTRGDNAKPTASVADFM